MKSVRFILAGLALCGGVVAAQAAVEVPGSNTMALIQKDVVKSATGHQLLIVPVMGTDITKGDNTDTPATLSQLLPASLYNGYTVVTVGDSSQTCKCTAEGWSSDPELLAGTIFWLSLTSARSTVTPLTTVTMLGNVKTLEKLDLTTVTNKGQVLADGNASTESLTIGDIEGVQDAQLFRIKEDSNSYELYTYFANADKPGWYDSHWNSADAVEIAAAEAFYYYVP